MRFAAIFTMMLLAGSAFAQHTECVDVPKGKKLVLVPWFVPTDQLTWKWKPAKDIVKPEEEEEECDELAVSPATCTKN